MFYEINVSLNGKHHFATADRSITSPETAKKLMEQFKGLFPESEGYSVQCTHFRKVGTCVEFDADGKEVEVSFKY